MGAVTVLASSDQPVPRSSLHGYAEIGADIVIGPAGQAEYGDVPAGHDGAYVSVVNDGADTARLGTDASGYARIFLYQHADRWALGTSLMGLAEHVSRRGWHLSIDDAQFKTFLLRARGMVGNQLTSLRTTFEEIRLLAPSEYAVVTGSSAPVVRIHQRPEGRSMDYRTALHDALEEMTGRLRTLLHSDWPMVSDLTGGRDSRTVLAALLAAHDSAASLGERVRFRSNSRIEQDWAIATLLSEKYGLRVNEKARGERYRVDADHSYRVWWTHDLGVYSPVYLMHIHTDEIALNGAAGGVHRRVYRTPVDELIRARRTQWLTDADVESLIAQMNETLELVGGRDDPRRSHYRLFRNRFHGGRNALRSLSVAPLASAKLGRASDLMSAEHLDRAQLYADIMLNLAPDLASEPYDQPDKGWDERHHRDLTRVEVTPGRSQGRIYGLREGPPARTATGRQPLEPFSEAFAAAAPAAVESGMLPRGYVDRATKALRETDGTMFGHAVDGVPVSTVILAGQAAQLAGGR